MNKTNAIILGLFVALIACHEATTSAHQFKWRRVVKKDTITNGYDTVHLPPRRVATDGAVLMTPGDTIRR